MVNNIFFFSKTVAFLRQCGKILLYSWRGHRWQYGACTLLAGYLRLHTHPHTQYVILIAFATATTVAPWHLSVKFTHTLPVFLVLYNEISIDIYCTDYI